MSKEQLVNELHKSARKNFKRRRVIIKGLDDLWQADLVEMGTYSADNKGYKFLLTVIDTFSKFAWAIPLKTKNGIEVTKAMKVIFESEKRKPRNLQTDAGKEFYNNHFKKLMKKYEINHYSTFSNLKASIVERFNRTLKGMMWKEFSLNGSFKWIENVSRLIKKYNHTLHRTIKMRPVDVKKSNEEKLLKTVYNNLKIYRHPKFKVGDQVRISKYKHAFEKGYTPNWTTEVFSIRKIQNTNPPTYILKDYQGHLIEGGFYEQELLKTNHGNTYLIEKILKKNRNKIFVKWLRFPNEHNSWINKNDII